MARPTGVLLLALCALPAGARAQQFLGFRYLGGECVDSTGAKGHNPGYVGVCGGLRAADLRQAVLSETDLSGADMQGARLNYAKLRGTLLVGANMRSAQLEAADLREADLQDAVLEQPADQ